MQKLQYNNQEVHYQQISTFFISLKQLNNLKQNNLRTDYRYIMSVCYCATL